MGTELDWPELDIECRFCGRVYERKNLDGKEIDAMEHGEPCVADDCPGHEEHAAATA